MAELHATAEALRTLLAEHFAAVRISTVQTQEQFLQEVRAIHPDRMPCVIIVYDGSTFNSPEGILEDRFTLVVIDKFIAGHDDRALSVFRAGARLLALFPATGRMLGEVFVHPADVVAASPDAQFSALAVGIVCKQGF